jgi:hypothetical protein
MSEQFGSNRKLEWDLVIEDEVGRQPPEGLPPSFRDSRVEIPDDGRILVADEFGESDHLRWGVVLEYERTPEDLSRLFIAALHRAGLNPQVSTYDNRIIEFQGRERIGSVAIHPLESGTTQATIIVLTAPET